MVAQWTARRWMGVLGTVTYLSLIAHTCLSPPPVLYHIPHTLTFSHHSLSQPHSYYSHHFYTLHSHPSLTHPSTFHPSNPYFHHSKFSWYSESLHFIVTYTPCTSYCDTPSFLPLTYSPCGLTLPCWPHCHPPLIPCSLLIHSVVLVMHSFTSSLSHSFSFYTQ